MLIKIWLFNILTDGLIVVIPPLFYPPAKKHRNASVERPAAEASWVERTGLVFEQLEGG